ncbi:phosphatase PAP2 family protein [Pseudomonas sp. TKO26]|uniref:undecaprenyl-diphosphatase n=1 Tax=unclassified Pseudomonas TaxID=196821 RepID=UPI000D99E8E1|nr:MULTISPECIES: undecaprenyl-diphosphatase [unclassified Pseudomonas]PYY80210.1 phosphatase PAP2 family protein [Pseudomonas sp. TKO30]PYY81515.1 phosphatase PAP2 family protein [Pseudomonas sp. TKO29]PYY83359.1 phosphatase PAP2 family protein [Pseudomonas sp. TKO26]PYY97479.1 phosphatase PAP2 family protein [Pseudomonas sp. TKO14]
MEELNQSLFLAINASAGASMPMRTLAVFLAQWLVLSVPLLLAVLWVFGERRQRMIVLLATLAIVLALASNLLIRELWFHPRPFMIGLGQNFLAHAPGASFPSDHASGMFAMAFALILAPLRKTGLVMLGLALLVSWARVYLGVHFPFDILGGCLVGLFSAWLVRQGLASRQLGERLLTMLEGTYLRLIGSARRGA